MRADDHVSVVITTVFIWKMDALKRPLRIPPDFIRYAEAEGIFELYERMLQELIIAKPEDPLQFLANYLARKDDNGMCACWRGLAPYGLA